jgi:hypothetical protein
METTTNQTSQKNIRYTVLLSAVAMFAIILGPNLVGSAFAWTVSNGYYSHEHGTDLANPHVVCGNHLCAPGEMPRHSSVESGGH